MDTFCKVCGHPTAKVAGEHCVACGQDPHQSFENEVELSQDFMDALIAEISNNYGGKK